MSRPVGGFRLGTVWFLRASGRARSLRTRRIVGMACSLAIVMLCVAVWQANADRAERGRAQEPRAALGATSSFEWIATNTPFDGDVWTTIFVRGMSEAPGPPGVPHLPRPEEAWVSPAVRDAIEADPGLADRIPGRVVGTIGEEGLQSPDQYLVQAGATSLIRASTSDGWGATVPLGNRPSIPALGLFGILVTMTGVPAALLMMISSRLSDESRRRALASLHLLGVPRCTLASAAATEAAWCAAIAAVLATIATAAVVSLTAPRGWLGFAWFTPATILPISVTAAGALAVLGVFVTVRRRTVMSLAAVLDARESGPRTSGPFAVAPLAVGVCLLSGLVLPHLLTGRAPSGELRYYGFLAGTCLAVFGAFAAMPSLLRAAARFVGWRRANVWTSLGAKRLWWDSDVLSRATAALLSLTTCGLIGSAVVADLDALSPRHREGDLYAVAMGHSSRSETLRLAAEPAPVRVLLVGEADDMLTVGTCTDLRELLLRADTVDVRSFDRACRPGGRFILIDPDDAEPRPHEDVVPVPGMNDTVLPEGSVLAVDPGDYRGDLTNAELLVGPGPENGAADHYAARLATASPTVAEMINASAGVHAAIVPGLRRLLLAMVATGFLLAAATLLLAHGDVRHRTAVHRARLQVMGASARAAGRPQVLATVGATSTCLIIATVVGWLAGLAYDLAGGAGAAPGWPGVAVTGAAAITAIVTGLLAFRDAGDEEVSPTELLHDE